MDYVFNYKRWLSLDELSDMARHHTRVTIDDETKAIVKKSREQLDKYVEEGRIIYGVNTSMGGFVNWLVPVEYAQKLQENLINAVATNVGKHLDTVSVRAIMLSRINSLCKGNSAISLRNLEVLIALYNKGVIPCIPEKGSLGTSGDLGPLAAIALVCCGQGNAYYQGKYMSGHEALSLAGIDAAELSYKEGLALINGTSGMTGLACCLLSDAKNLLEKYCVISALSFEGLTAIKKPFDPKVHQLKPHLGQRTIAENIYRILEDSSLIQKEADTEKFISAENDGTIKSSSKQIEDAYSIRCTPQILGPVLDSIEYNINVVENELNSSNDNPLVVPNINDVYHNGHFHGQYVAMSMDFLSIALTTLCNLSNRRIDRFLDKSNSNGLPAFLCDVNAGLRLGLMGGQFMTASITAENRSLCTPLSIQSLTSTADFQDIVSFGFVAARRAREIHENVKYVIAFELICACQAVDIRGCDKISSATKNLYDEVRTIVPFFDCDISMTDYIENIVEKVL
jgi:phenylalanine aminomutase (D-beta-phenylalanine forming)